MVVDESIDFDRSQLGVEHVLGTWTITRDMIVRFARATSDADPRYDGEGSGETLMAPPTFCNALTSGGGRPDIKLAFGNAQLFAGQAIDCIELVREGDTLTATTWLKDVYAKTGRSGKMAFMVWETVFTNQHRCQVVRVRESYVQRQVGTD